MLCTTKCKCEVRIIPEDSVEVADPTCALVEEGCQSLIPDDIVPEAGEIYTREMCEDMGWDGRGEDEDE